MAEWRRARFRPAAIEKFDLDALRRDCEQLWAEAAHYEADGESITLQEDLWGAASEVVRRRRTLEDPIKGSCRRVFRALSWLHRKGFGKPSAFPQEKHLAAGKYVGMAMRAIGFLRKQARSDCDVERGSVIIKLKKDDWYYERRGNDEE